MSLAFSSLTSVASQDVVKTAIPLDQLADAVLLTKERSVRADPVPAKSASPDATTWFQTLESLTDFFLNACGLDILDELILKAAEDEWVSAIRIATRVMDSTPKQHLFVEGRIWQRILELAGKVSDYPPGAQEEDAKLLDFTYEGGVPWGKARVRRTELGRKAVGGLIDVAERRNVNRWIGGLLFNSADSEIRRSGLLSGQ